MTARSFFSLARIDFVLGDALANLLQLVQQLVDGELGQAIELQFENGVDLAEREAFLLVRQPLAVELDDDLACPCPRHRGFRALQLVSPKHG